MSWADLTNAAFECGGAFAVALNCLALYRSRRVEGVSYVAMGFFTSWGVWNLYFYPSLEQWASFFAGIGLVTFNLLWLAMAWHFHRQGDQA